jgi:hypothetical protein
MGALTIKLRIGQHETDGDPLVGRAHQRTPGGTVVGRTAPGRLREDETAVEVHDHGPFQPVAPGAKPVASTATVVRWLSWGISRWMTALKSCSRTGSLSRRRKRYSVV